MSRYKSQNYGSLHYHHQHHHTGVARELYSGGERAVGGDRCVLPLILPCAPTVGIRLGVLYRYVDGPSEGSKPI